jgi:aspartokinase-like uncharacterized kinase
MWTVVKVGGSLYDWPELGPRLRAWLTQLDAPRVLIVPGGGATADAIRAFDRVHQIGEKAAHWLAIETLSVNARFLHALMPEAAVSATPEECEARWCILDALPFFRADEASPDHLPHCWDVTSDSLAVRAAALLGARELVLLKSVDSEGGNWCEGVVDAYFAKALERANCPLQMSLVNLRQI